MPPSRWMPFEEARAIVVAQEFKNQAEYYAWKGRPPEIPTNPRGAYKDEWRGWEYWLGKGPPGKRPGERVPPLPFEEARVFARQVAAELGMKSQRDWVRWAQTGSKPPGIPADPATTYKRSGWTRWPDWLGREPTRASGKELVRSFVDAREFAKSLNLKSSRAWYEWARLHRPADIPYSPDTRYRDEGFIGWGDFLGYHSRWTHQGIVAFLDSLKPVVTALTEMELYLILSKNGMLRRDRRFRGARILRSLTNLKTPEDIDKSKETFASELDGEQGEEGKAEDKDGDVQEDGTGSDVTVEDLDDVGSCLPPLKCLDDLKTLDQVVEAKITEDPDVLEFMVQNRVSALWQQLMATRQSDQAAMIAEVQLLHEGAYCVAVRDRFLKEYQEAMALPRPEGYDFRGESGELLEPNPMQRLTAYRLVKEKRLGNWSGVGAGKTNAAIYSAGVLGAELTVVLAANATLDNVWHDAIQRVLPAAVVHVKDQFAFVHRPGLRNFLVVNYEGFQQEWSNRFIAELTSRNRIDFLVLDEVQFARQRKAGVNNRSRRRELVENLVAEAAAKNPELRILGMSATPVVNNLHEAVKLLELILPEQDFSAVPVGASVANAAGVHLLLRRHGIRHRPPLEQAIDLVVPKLDGSDLLPYLLSVPARDLLRMEQVLVERKIRDLKTWLCRGTMIYTWFVQGIVERIKEAVTAAGFRFQEFTGHSRVEIQQFVADFKANRVDVLIGSSPVGTGVDRLQHVLNRLIFMSLPWSNAEYQQIVGRLYRQGSPFKEVKVIIPQVVLREERAGLWSWDDLRLRCIEYKRTLADAALDGVIPVGGLPSKEELQRQSKDALDAWVQRVGRGMPPSSPETPTASEARE